MHATCAGPLLDEAAKQRAALMMEYRGKPPAEALQLQGGTKAGSSSSPRRPLSERERLEARFAELSSEVEERDGFLRDMQVGGWTNGGGLHDWHLDTSHGCQAAGKSSL